MGHEQIGQPELVLEVEHQVQDLRLHRDVEGRDRLVGDHEARVERQGPGDPDALALPPAEGVGVAAHVLGPEPDQSQELGDALRPLVPRAHAVGQRAARRRCRAASSAGSARRTGPGRSSASRGAAGAAVASGGSRRRPPGRRPVRKRISPAVGVIARRMQREVVVLPQPLSPTSDSVSPRRSVEAHVVDRPHVADQPAQESPADREELPKAPHVEKKPVGGRVRVEPSGSGRPVGGGGIGRPGVSSGQRGHVPARTPAKAVAGARGG